MSRILNLRPKYSKIDFLLENKVVSRINLLHSHQLDLFLKISTKILKNLFFIENFRISRELKKMEDGSSKFILKRKDLQTECYSQFVEFKSDGSFCDIILKSGEKELSVHRVILAATVPYFRAKFQNSLRESKQKIIQINEIDPAVLKDLVNLSYGMEIEFHLESGETLKRLRGDSISSNLEKFMIGIKFLMLDSVKDTLTDSLVSRLDLQNVLEIRRLAEKFEWHRLVNVATQFIDENFSDFANSEIYLQLDIQELIDIIKKDQLAVNEESVYEVVMKWIKHAASDRIAEMPKIFQFVRLCRLSPTYLYDVVRLEKLLQISAECRALVNEAMCFHMMSGIRELPKTNQSRPRNSNFGLIYIVGGNFEEEENATNIKIYDPLKDEWSIEKYSGKNEKILAASIVYDGKLYLFGGEDH